MNLRRNLRRQALDFGARGIVSGRKQFDGETAGGVGKGGARRSRGRIHDCDGGVGDRMSVGIEDGAADGSGGSDLRAKRDGEDQGGDGDSNPSNAGQSRRHGSHLGVEWARKEGENKESFSIRNCREDVSESTWACAVRTRFEAFCGGGNGFSPQRATEALWAFLQDGGASPFFEWRGDEDWRARSANSCGRSGIFVGSGGSRRAMGDVW